MHDVHSGSSYSGSAYAGSAHTGDADPNAYEQHGDTEPHGHADLNANERAVTTH